jgi:hypothetical protein
MDEIFTYARDGVKDQSGLVDVDGLERAMWLTRRLFGRGVYDEAVERAVGEIAPKDRINLASDISWRDKADYYLAIAEMYKLAVNQNGNGHIKKRQAKKRDNAEARYQELARRVLE